MQVKKKLSLCTSKIRYCQCVNYFRYFNLDFFVVSSRASICVSSENAERERERERNKNAIVYTDFAPMIEDTIEEAMRKHGFGESFINELAKSVRTHSV